MAATRRPAGPPLGDFLTALAARLGALAPEDLAAALVAHAERLPVGSRQAFLDIFPEPHARPTGQRVVRDDLLLADIDALTARVAAGEFTRDDDWYDDDDRFDRRYDRYGGDDRDSPDGSWVQDADALFAAAGEAFVAGRLDLACGAYSRLLDLFDPNNHDGPVLETWQLETTDVGEALARYLRALYERTGTQDRAGTIHRAYLALPWSAAPPTLQDVAAARQGDLPDLQSFLPAWIGHLLAETARPSPGHRNRLLAEATVLHRGVGGLADLARSPGPHQAGIHLAWIDALATADRLQESADAAREALQLQSADTAHHAAAADRLAEVTTRLGDPTGAVEARRRAWRTEPTRRRLLALVTAGRAAGTLTQTLDAEAEAVRGSERLSCELLLLAGHVDAAIAALARSDPRGWSSPTHPGPVVLPYLWIAATAAAAPPADSTHLGRSFAAIDLDLDLDPRFHLDPDLDDPEQDDGPVGGDTAQPDAPGATLTTLLTRAILERPGSPSERRGWLAAAAATVDQRVDAVVRNKHRRAYARVASLIVAHAETLTITGKAAEGLSYIAGMRQKYPRHTAFRAELDAATDTSTLTSA